MNKLKKILTTKFLAIAASLGLLAVFIAIALVSMYHSGPGNGKQVDFSIPAGAGSIAVTNKLFKAGLIKSRTYYRLYLRATGNAANLKRGIYTLDDSMSAGQITEVITSGHTKTKRVVIPEGYNNRQIGDVLSKAGFFEDRADFLKFASNQSILAEYKIPADTTEGYLFPSTYHIPIGYPKKKIIKLMLDTFLEQTQTLKDFPTNSTQRHDLIILASIVEREAKLKSELPKIAGVFANRLKINQPLESCATIQYLFEKPKVKLYYKDLEVKSPYNTYKNPGLPPGPIASPGLSALRGALNPEATPYRFFVVRADGSHYFSKTFAEHNMAKKKYMFK